MNLDQFSGNLKAFLNEFNSEFPEYILVVGITAKSLIQDRFQSQGLNANNEVFGEYTPFTKRKRGEKGLQTSFVDLTDTGDMWRSIGVIGINSSGSNANVTIGSNDSETIKKLNDNTERFGSEIMDVSFEERADMTATVDYNIQQLINRFL